MDGSERVKKNDLEYQFRLLVKCVLNLIFSSAEHLSEIDIFSTRRCFCFDRGLFHLQAKETKYNNVLKAFLLEDQLAIAPIEFSRFQSRVFPRIFKKRSLLA